MSSITDAIDQIIVDCSKRDLVPSVEVVDALLDVRSLITTAEALSLSVPHEEAPANV